MSDGLINLTHDDRETKIYRVFSFQRFLELVKQKQMTLVRPRMWDDPFENFVLNSTGITRQGELFAFGFCNASVGIGVFLKMS